jgi:putative membrane protein
MKLQRILTVVSIGSLALSLGASAWAKDDAREQPTSKETLKSSTEAQSFLREAAEGGMAEVDMGSLASQRASNPDVKAFGLRMVKDHTAANQDLKSVAAKSNVSIPTTVDAEHKSMHERFASLSGSEFDKAYMKEMTSDHEKDVAAFKKAQSSSDPNVAAFASRTLPTLEEHLKEAKRVETEVSSQRTSRAASDSRLGSQ